MGKLNVTYFCPDAADRIADLIHEEETKLRLATRTRDKHRSTTTIMAYKEALAVVLLERECTDGEPHPMPNVDEYLKSREQPPVV